jgi:uncharacterized protein YodC (DUF2158 family)
MSEKIEAGSTVVLKSGGPLMTVKWIDGTEVYCEWFDGKKLVGDKFLTTSLEISDNEPIV